MSAIVGYWSWARPRAVGRYCGEMLAAQKLYGPHATDMHVAPEIALGRALHVSLPEDRHDRQPLVDRSGRFTLVADVRLDNRDDLLELLGHRGRDAAMLADAEVLLLAFEAWGDDFLDRLNGDFAVAIWDAGERQLTLARDPLGQRPLFYYEGVGFTAFASMPKGLHALNEITRQPDAARLIDYLAFIPAEGSAGYYQNVRRVAPGHAVTVSPTGIRSRQWWVPRPRALNYKRLDDYVDAFRAEIDRSVRVRLRGAGERVGAQLSSGWDSSTVTTTASRLLASDGGCVVAYTSVPGADLQPTTGRNSLGDEGSIAAATASLHANIEHVLIRGAAKSPLADLNAYVSAFDRPVYSLCNHVWLTDIREAARANGIQVILTGELGNWTVSSAPYTLLADYIREGRWLDWLREARALGSSRSARYRGIAANSFGPWLPKPVWNLVRPLSSRLEVLHSTAINPKLLPTLRRRQEARGAGLANRPKNYRADIARGLNQYDFGEQRKGALGGWGIDERDPTADRHLVEFCLSLPIDMLLKNGVRRPLARAALSDRLPPAVLDEKQKGYQAADWHRGLTNARPELSALVEAMATNDLANELIDVPALRTWIRDWPQDGWETPAVTSRYRYSLLTAISAGHFILDTTR